MSCRSLLQADLLQVSCAEGDRIVAHRIEENVPIFRENIKIVPGMPSHPIESRLSPEVVPKPPEGSKIGAVEGSKIGAPEGSKIGAHDSDADSEGGVEWVRAEMQRARSIEHRLAHFPKSNLCSYWIMKSSALKHQASRTQLQCHRKR